MQFLEVALMIISVSNFAEIFYNYDCYVSPIIVIEWWVFLGKKTFYTRN